MSALLALQLCVCDSDSEYECGDTHHESNVAKALAGDVARSEQIAGVLSHSGGNRGMESFPHMYAPASRLQAMKLATSGTSPPCSPSPSFMINMKSFSQHGAPLLTAPSSAITSIKSPGWQSTSMPLQRCTSGPSQISLAQTARTALHCDGSSVFFNAGTQLASPRSVSFRTQPTSPRGSAVYRQTSNPSIGSPRSSSFVVGAQSYQRLQCNSFSSSGQVRGRVMGEPTAPSSPRLCSPIGRQVSFPSGSSSTTLGEVVSHQVSTVGQSSSFSSTGIPGSSVLQTSPRSPRARSPVGQPSLFWRSDSSNGNNTLSPRPLSPPPRASEGFSPFWQSPRGERPSTSVEAALTNIKNDLEPPPGLLGDLLRAVPQTRQLVRPKTVFWQPPPEAAAVCGVRSLS